MNGRGAMRGGASPSVAGADGTRGPGRGLARGALAVQTPLSLPALSRSGALVRLRGAREPALAALASLAASEPGRLRRGPQRARLAEAAR